MEELGSGEALDDDDRGEWISVPVDELTEVLFSLLYKTTPRRNWDGYMGGFEMLLELDRDMAIAALGWLFGDPHGEKDVEYLAQTFGIDLADIPNPSLCDSGCGTNVDQLGEFAYMVTDDVWAQAGDPDGRLCIACLEGRLGRLLVPADFNADVSLTTDDAFHRSPQLLARMGRSGN